MISLFSYIKNKFSSVKRYVSKKVNYLYEWQYGREIASNGGFTSLLNAYNSWVYICVSKNAGTLANVKFKLYYRKTEQNKGKKTLFPTRKIDKKQTKYLNSQAGLQSYLTKSVGVEQVLSHPMLDLLNNCNNFMNWMDLCEITVINQDLTGNHYWYILKNKMGVPVELWPIPANRIEIVPSKEKFISGYLYKYGNQEILLKEDEIIHFKYANPVDPYYGVGCLKAVATQYDINENMDKYENALFTNNGRPEGILKTEAKLKKEVYDRLTDSWNDKNSGVDNVGKTPILEQGLDFKAISIPPRDLAFLQGRKLTKEQIFLAFGLSLAMFSDNSNRTNAESASENYMRDTISPRTKRIASKINEKLSILFDPNLFIAFDDPVPANNDFLIMERESNLKTGYSSINIERQKDGEDDVPWGNEPLVPMGTVPLSINIQNIENLNKIQNNNNSST